MRIRMLIGVVAVVALGCGGSKKAVPVSGTVTLDGKPLANATVSFQPWAPKGKMDAGGVGSTGKTNEKGEFTLTLVNGGTGAVTGKHRVVILSHTQAADDDGDARPKRGGPEITNRVPERYGPGGKDELSFDVPSGGTNKADFPLTSQ